MGPPPEMRAKLDKMHADAKAASFNALSTDHRTKVQAIVGQVTAGTVTAREAVQQIDTLLTPDEKSGVFAASKKMRADVRAAMRADHDGPPPDAASHNGPPGPGGPAVGAPGVPPPAGGHEMHRRRPDAGRYLLMMSMTPDQMHALHRKANPTP